MDEINEASLRKNIKLLLKKMPSELGTSDISKLEPSLGATNNTPSRSNSSGKLRNLADKGDHCLFLQIFLHLFLNSSSKRSFKRTSAVNAEFEFKFTSPSTFNSKYFFKF